MMKTILTAAERNRVGLVCRLLAMEGKFLAIELCLSDLALGTYFEQQHCAAEWRANYHHHEYSVWPRYAAPRHPRPNSEREED